MCNFQNLFSHPPCWGNIVVIQTPRKWCEQTIIGLAHQLQLFVPLYVVKFYTKFQPIPTETLPSTRTKTRVYRIYIAPKTIFPFPKWHHRALSPPSFLTLVVAPRPSIWIWHRRWEEEHSWPFRKQKRLGRRRDDVDWHWLAPMVSAENLTARLWDHGQNLWAFSNPKTPKSQFFKSS